MKKKNEHKLTTKFYWLTFIIRTIKYSAIVSVFIFFISGAMLESSIVQTYLIQRFSDHLTEITDFPTSVKKVDIKIFHLSIAMDSVKICDSENNEMISIESLETQFRLRSLLRNKNFSIDKLLLHTPKVKLVYSQDTLNFSNWLKILKTLGKEYKSDSLKFSPKFLTNDIVINNGYFSLYNGKLVTDDSIRFYPKNIILENINTHITNFRVAKDTIELYVHNLNAKEKHSNLSIHQLNTFFHFSEKTMKFDQLHAEIGESILRDSLVFSYAGGTKDFQHFNEKIYINARLDNSIIVLKDLVPFLPLLHKYSDVLDLSGDFSGTLADCQIKNLDFFFGKKSHLAGKATFIGLPNILESYIDLNLKQSFVEVVDIAKYIPLAQRDIIEKFTTVDFNTRFSGFISNFTTKGNFQTNLGFLKTDISLNMNENNYRGNIATKDFDLGKLLNIKTIGKIDMDGFIQGKEFYLDLADFVLGAKIHQLDISGYSYRNIKTNSHLRKKLFEGKLIIKDKNLMMNVEGIINFEDSIFKFTALLDTVNFQSLGIIPLDITFQTKVNVDFKGLKPENFDGTINFYDTQLSYWKRILTVDSLLFTTRYYPENKGRSIDIDSDLFEFFAEGKFDFQSTFTHISQLYNQYIYSLPYQDSLAFIYYSKERKKPKANNFNISLTLHEFQSVFDWLGYDINLSKGTQIKGDISLGDFSDISIDIKSDTIAINKIISGYDNTIQLLLSKQADSIFFYHEIFFSSQKQKIIDKYTTKDFSTLFYREENGFVLDTYIHHPDSSDYINLKAYVDVLDNHYKLNLSDSRFSLGNQHWQNQHISNVVLYNGGNIAIKDIHFISGNQSLKVAGSVSFDPTDSLVFKLKGIDLSAFNSYFDLHNLSGKANINLSVKDIYKNMNVNSYTDISNIVYNDFSLGDLKGNLEWEEYSRKTKIDIDFSHEEETIFTMKGDFSTKSDTSTINLSAFLEGIPLNLLTPFIKNYVSDIEGVALGYIDISGSRKKPKMYGDIFIDDGQVRINYLNTLYRFNDKIRLRNTDISLKKFHLKDENQQSAYLNGTIDLNDKRGIYLDMQGNVENFQILNTSSTDNSLYYGKAIASGDFTVEGTKHNITMNVDAKGEKDTKIYIPLEGKASTQVKDFITFVKPTDQQEEIIPKPQSNESLIKINLNLDVSPNIYCEIIFDKQTRDIIRGRGQGKLKMNIDTKGKFEMYGNVNILEGAYNFIMFNIVDKKFEIVPGSYITWDGNPYQAQLNLTAAYGQSVSLAPIITDLDSTILQIQEMKQRYPVNVLLYMKGPMLKPDLTFGININDYPSNIITPNGSISLESYVAAFNQNILTNKRELNRQVFSLIALKRLSPPGILSHVSAGNLAINSVTELLNNQLSYWLSQVHENLEVGIDLGTVDKNALDNFQLNLSYILLDGRFRVSRNSSVTNGKNSSLFGDIAIEYLLDEVGKYRIKIYRKENANLLETGTGIQSATGGASISYNASFDRLFSEKKKKERISKKNTSHKRKKKIPSF